VPPYVDDGHESLLKEHGADVVIHDPNDLPGALSSLGSRATAQAVS